MGSLRSKVTHLTHVLVVQLILIHICPQQLLLELKNRRVLLSQPLLQGILGIRTLFISLHSSPSQMVLLTDPFTGYGALALANWVKTGTTGTLSQGPGHRLFSPPPRHCHLCPWSYPPHALVRWDALAPPSPSLARPAHSSRRRSRCVQTQKTRRGAAGGRGAPRRGAVCPNLSPARTPFPRGAGVPVSLRSPAFGCTGEGGQRRRGGEGGAGCGPALGLREGGGAPRAPPRRPARVGAGRRPQPDSVAAPQGRKLASSSPSPAPTLGPRRGPLPAFAPCGARARPVPSGPERRAKSREAKLVADSSPGEAGQCGACQRVAGGGTGAEGQGSHPLPRPRFLVQDGCVFVSLWNNVQHSCSCLSRSGAFPPLPCWRIAVEIS